MSFHQRLRHTAGRTTLALALMPGALLLTSALGLPTTAGAQRPAARTLDGTVTRDGSPVKGAVVHLKDTRTLAQKSYITAEDGTYRFAQLSSTTDYEVWAEMDGKKSPVKSVSSFDTKSAFNIALKID